MKKAFDANVSRARPKLRLGAMLGTSEAASVSQETVESLAQAIAQEPVIPSREEPADLSSAFRAKLTARAFKPSAAEVLSSALQTEVPSAKAPVMEPVAAVHVVDEPVVAQQPVEVVMAQPKTVVVQTVKNGVEAPHEVREVQTAPVEAPQPDAADRREKLRERLKAVRENPRPEPLPETVAEAGVLAVERIAALQSELAKTRAVNLALSQDLEAARRQAERATEEARLRMDEARRLSSEMEGRVHLLADLERELSSLEGERNEALLALQESRQAIEAGERERLELRDSLTAKDGELEASLQEEERLASELEATHEAMSGLRRSADALKSERDTLARQVSDLTKERAELLEARKALEAVHRALAKASVLA
ncbi:MAG: extensin-like protein [Myxococcales bacterium]|nr:extensin-like protein [Myxococcales bacterium]MDP3499839.1 extensin-like protein [Myxococcales bacterium]